MRTVHRSIPIPSGSQRRGDRETGVSGGDGEPYLICWRPCWGRYERYRRRGRTPCPITGNAYAAELPQIPGDWKSRSMLRDSEEVNAFFAPKWCGNFILTSAKSCIYCKNEPRKSRSKSIWTRC